MPTIPQQLDQVSLQLKANVYFDGAVVSHTITAADGARRSVGAIRPGTYHFNTDSAERMDIIAGACAVKQAGSPEWKYYGAGESFSVPAKSGFDIRVDGGLAEYLCTYG